MRAEVVGAAVPSPDEIAAIEQTLTSEIAAPVMPSVWARAEVVVTETRYESLQERVEAELRRRREAAAGTAETEQPAGSLRLPLTARPTGRRLGVRMHPLLSPSIGKKLHLVPNAGSASKSP